MLSEIYRVDIEFHSKCNRKCPWCPNSSIDRMSKDEIFDKDLFIKLITDLYNNNFGKKSSYGSNFAQAVISFIGYQEPFLQPELLKEYVSIVKNIFYDRNICLLVNSNGDYFSEENLDNLNLSLVNIMDYDCKGKKYWEEKLKANKCAIIESSPNYIVAIHNHVNSVQVFLDWPKQHALEDKGGLLDPNTLSSYQWKNNRDVRKVPCPEPSYYINIYHNGDVTPCCHIRPDAELHQDYILGNLYDNSIVDIFYGEKASSFRKKMSSWQFENYPKPCQFCQKTRDQQFEFIEGLEFPIYRGTQLHYNYNLLDMTYNPLGHILQPFDFSTEEKQILYELYNNLINANIPVEQEQLKEYFNYYYKNFLTLIELYDTQYLDLGDSHIARIRTIFNEESAYQDLNGLIQEYLLREGFYTCFLSFKKFIYNNLTTIIEGRKRFIALQGLALQKTTPPYHSITIHLDAKKSLLSDNVLYFPAHFIDLIEKNTILNERIRIVEKNSSNFYAIQTDCEITLFMLIMAHQQLMNQLLDKYISILPTLEIYPQASISKVKGISVNID